MWEFLIAIGPSLFELAKALYENFAGDAEAANREIKDRTNEIRQRRKKRDEQLDDKFPLDDDDDDTAP